MRGGGGGGGVTHGSYVLAGTPVSWVFGGAAAVSARRFTFTLSLLVQQKVVERVKILG